MYSYVVIKDTETWGGSLLRLIMDTMTIWTIPMGKHSKNLPRKSLQRILGRFQISFQEGGFLYVEAKAWHWKRTQERVMWAQGVRKIIIWHMESENTYHWKRRNMDTNHQFYPIFWGVRPSCWCFFFFHWTKLRYLLCPVALQPGCRWNPGRLTGRWLGWLFPKAIVGLVQCHEVYELQIGSLVEKAYPSNSFSKGVLLGRCLAEQTGQLSCWDLLQLLTRIRLCPWERFLQDLHQCNLQHRLNGCRWIIQLNWQVIHIASHNPMNKQGVSFSEMSFKMVFLLKALLWRVQRSFWVMRIRCMYTTYIQLYDELLWTFMICDSSQFSMTFYWSKSYILFVPTLWYFCFRTLGHRPLEYSRSLHIKGPKLCQV